MLEAALFVMVHTIPMLGGPTEIRSTETFVQWKVCMMRAKLLNRVDPSNFYYTCEPEVDKY